MSEKKIWTQAAIDVIDIDLAKRIAKLAMDSGSEWLEIGTPLLYTYGHSVIKEIRKYVGNDVVLVPDYKTPLSILCAKQAKEFGADYLLVSASYSDMLNKYNIETCLNEGITPIIDLMNIRADDAQIYVDRCADLGAQYFFTRHFMSYTDKTGNEIKVDNLKLKMPEGTKLGITNDEFDDAVYCAANGADWIVFGRVLWDPKEESCRKWINAIHNAR